VTAIDNKSSIICQSVGDQYPKTHSALITKKIDRLEYEFKSLPRVIPTSVERAFRALQADECRAIYGSAAELKGVLEGAKIAKVKYHVLPIWFSTADFDDERAAIANKYQSCLRQVTELKRVQGDSAAIRKNQAEQNDESRKALQDQLRKENGVAARSFESAVYSEIKEYLESPKDKHVGVRQKYPQFVRWYEADLLNGWELMSSDSALADYGVVEWKGRVLATGFVEIRTHLRNRSLGEYQHNCHVFGYILDNEFDVAREPIVASCQDDAIAKYKMGRKFASRWIVTNAPASAVDDTMSAPNENRCDEWQEGLSVGNK
jgi:hypothetical protein